jgi:hypothetical protein
LKTKSPGYSLLLPGFLSLTIIGLMVNLPELSEFNTVFYSLILLSVCLMITSCFSFLIRVQRPRLFYTLNVIISIAIGIAIGLAIEKDMFFVALRSMPFTKEFNKRSSLSPLLFVLSQNTRGQLAREGDARPTGKKSPMRGQEYS